MKAEYTNLVVTKQGSSVILRINRPEMNNKLNRVTGFAIIDAIKDANDDPDVKVIIITGTGTEYFCGGGEVDNHPNGTFKDYERYSESFCRIHYAIYDSWKPVLAAVQGKAVAGGFSVTEACDIAVCSDTTVFALPEITHGMFPMMALATTQKSVPKKHLLKISYTAGLLSAEEALKYNIVNEVVPQEKVLERTLEIAEEIAQYSSDAIGVGRRAYYAMLQMPVKDALEYSRAALYGSLYTDDAIAMCQAVADGTMPMDYIKSRK